MDVDEDTGSVAAAGCYPAYNIPGVKSNTPAEYECHCASAGDFCFFCEYQCGACPDESGADLCADLMKMVNEMIRNKRELVAISQKVQSVYDNEVRQYVHFESNGVAVSKPAWTIRSIERHLMYSTQFKAVFSDWVERCFQAQLVRVNATMLEEEGRVCEVASKQWARTVKSYTDFMRANQLMQKNKG